MAEYHLKSVWRIEAPLEEVYAAVQNSLGWPAWWPGVQTVESLADGDADGINSIRRYVWQGKLPYHLVLDVRATRIENLLLIGGRANGDLEGYGRWHFSRQAGVSIVSFEWHVRSTRWWMNLLAPFARVVFIHNHGLIMKQGGEGLAQRLGSPLLSQETLDLVAESLPAMTAGEYFREGGRIDPGAVLFVGVAAGVIATVAQLAMWWLVEIPVAETLFRDARLTAALLMGTGVLPPPATAQWDVLLVATLIHFALSVAYAVLPALLSGRQTLGHALLIGAAYGLAIYGVNLYGLTLFFPWFVVARDGITLLTHLVFGAVLFGGCQLLKRTHDPV